MVDFKKLRRNLDCRQMLYTATAAARILGLEPFSITNVVEAENDLFEATAKDKEVHTIHKREFIHYFVSSRKSRSQTLKIESTEYSNVYLITNPENYNCYPIRHTATGIECKCRDYQKQQEAFGKGCCKHGYRLLAQLGCSSLEDYLKSQKAIAA